jgi:hypothetical protein
MVSVLPSQLQLQALQVALQSVQSANGGFLWQRLSDSVENIVNALFYGNTIVKATPQNCDQMNQVIGLVLSSVQELRDRIATDRSKHLIAKTSSLGWRFVSSLESLEGQVGHISMVQLRSQEKAYFAHKLAVSSLAKSGSGAGAGGSGGRGGGGGGGKGVL